jgi:hypothetical protein
MRRSILIAGLVALAVLTVYVPWTHTLRTWGEYGGSIERPAGYGFIFEPPEPVTRAWGVRIDLVRIAIPVAFVIFATAGGLMLTRPTSPSAPPADPQPTTLSKPSESETPSHETKVLRLQQFCSRFGAGAALGGVFLLILALVAAANHFLVAPGRPVDEVNAQPDLHWRNDLRLLRELTSMHPDEFDEEAYRAYRELEKTANGPLPYPQIRKKRGTR